MPRIRSRAIEPQLVVITGMKLMRGVSAGQTRRDAARDARTAPVSVSAQLL